MADDQHYDVVIIGTGAGGGTLGHRLATSGAKVLWLERGDFLPRERDNWSTQAVFVRGKYLAPEVWYDGHGRDFQPEVNYYVGGNTKFYGAALFRLRPEDFGELRHHGGISPAWPISYDELEPYYTQAEHLTWCTATTVRTRARATPARSTPIPVSHEPRIQQLNDDLEKLGCTPFTCHRGQPRRGGTGKADKDERLHPLRPPRWLPVRARREVGLAGHLRGSGPLPGQRHLVTGAHVQRLETDASGRTVTGVVTALDDGRSRPSPATSWWSPWRGDSAALLLRSPTTATRRGWRTARGGRPPLHAAQQHRPDGRLPRTQSHPFPEDAGDERLVPRRRRLGVSPRRDADAGQV